MKRTLICLGLLLVCLASCQGRQTSPLPTASPRPATPVPSATPTLDLSPAQTATDWAQFQVTMSALRTEVAAAASTVTPFVASTRYFVTGTYQNKKPLIVYGSEMKTQDNLDFILHRGPFYMRPQILLYSDGQLIMGDRENRLQEVNIPQTEVNRLMAKLNQFDLDQLDSILTCPLECIAWANMWCILFVGGEEQHLIYFDPWLVRVGEPDESILDIQSILGQISFQDTTLNQPDRLLVEIHSEMGIPAGNNSTVIWPGGVTSPLLAASDGVLYLVDEEANRVYQAANGATYAVFSYNGVLYPVFLRPIFPHECWRWYPSRNSNLDIQPSFQCDDWDPE